MTNPKQLGRTRVTIRCICTFFSRDNGKTTIRRRIHRRRSTTSYGARDGACIVRILKTRKMSRVEIPEILRGDKPTHVAGNSLVTSMSLTRSDITKCLAIFQRWATTSRSSTDSAVQSDTCSLDRRYDRESLREIVRRAEIPRSNYHALRRVCRLQISTGLRQRDSREITTIGRRPTSTSTTVCIRSSESKKRSINHKRE